MAQPRSTFPLTTAPQPITGIYKEIEDRQRSAERRIQRCLMREEYAHAYPREQYVHKKSGRIDTSMNPYTTPPNFSRVDQPQRDQWTTMSQTPAIAEQIRRLEESGLRRNDRASLKHMTTGNVIGKGYLYDPDDCDPLLVLRPSMWLPSDVQQRGLYTTKDIPYIVNRPRKPITQYAGVIRTKNRQCLSSETSYWRGIDFNTVIDGFKEPFQGFGMAQFCNDPRGSENMVNCELKADNKDSTIQLLYPLEKVSIRAGDELLIDYGEGYWDRDQDDNSDSTEDTDDNNESI